MCPCSTTLIWFTVDWWPQTVRTILIGCLLLWVLLESRTLESAGGPQWAGRPNIRHGTMPGKFWVIVGKMPHSWHLQNWLTDGWDWSWGKDPVPFQGPQAPHPLFLLLPADLYEKIGSNSLEANPRYWNSGQFCRSGSTLLRAIQMWPPAPSPALLPSGNSPTLSHPSHCSCAFSPESPFSFHFHSYTSSSCGPVHAWQTSSYSPSLKGVAQPGGLVRHWVVLKSYTFGSSPPRLLCSAFPSLGDGWELEVPIHLLWMVSL